MTQVLDDDALPQNVPKAFCRRNIVSLFSVSLCSHF
jgi:hypothetical protein